MESQQVVTAQSSVEETIHDAKAIANKEKESILKKMVASMAKQILTFGKEEKEAVVLFNRQVEICYSTFIYHIDKYPNIKEIGSLQVFLESIRDYSQPFYIGQDEIGDDNYEDIRIYTSEAIGEFLVDYLMSESTNKKDSLDYKILSAGKCIDSHFRHLLRLLSNIEGIHTHYLTGAVKIFNAIGEGLSY